MAENSDVMEATSGEDGVTSLIVAEGDKAPEAPPSGELSSESDVPRATRQQVSASKAAVIEAVEAWERQKQAVQQAIGNAADAGLLRRESGQLSLCLAEVKSVYKKYSRLIDSDAQMEVQINDVIEYTDELVKATSDAVRQAAMETESIRSSARSKKASSRRSPNSGLSSGRIEAQLAFVEEDAKLQEQLLQVQRETLKAKHELNMQRMQTDDSDQELSSQSDGVSKTSRQRTEQYIDEQYPP